ncbi:MAG: hypothetical protein K9W44_10800 [Candidatus Lokiarchaeota archaeon]|nr:hypothetical protein [Candidatus Harpocratesius repetitus]
MVLLKTKIICQLFHIENLYLEYKRPLNVLERLILELSSYFEKITAYEVLFFSTLKITMKNHIENIFNDLEIQGYIDLVDNFDEENFKSNISELKFHFQNIQNSKYVNKNTRYNDINQKKNANLFQNHDKNSSDPYYLKFSIKNILNHLESYIRNRIYYLNQYKITKKGLKALKNNEISISKEQSAIFALLKIADFNDLDEFFCFLLSRKLNWEMKRSLPIPPLIIQNFYEKIINSKNKLIKPEDDTRKFMGYSPEVSGSTIREICFLTLKLDSNFSPKMPKFKFLKIPKKFSLPKLFSSNLHNILGNDFSSAFLKEKIRELIFSKIGYADNPYEYVKTGEILKIHNDHLILIYYSEDQFLWCKKNFPDLIKDPYAEKQISEKIGEEIEIETKFTILPGDQTSFCFYASERIVHEKLSSRNNMILKAELLYFFQSELRMLESYGIGIVHNSEDQYKFLEEIAFKIQNDHGTLFVDEEIVNFLDEKEIIPNPHELLWMNVDSGKFKLFFIDKVVIKAKVSENPYENICQIEKNWNIRITWKNLQGESMEKTFRTEINIIPQEMLVNGNVSHLDLFFRMYIAKFLSNNSNLSKIKLDGLPLVSFSSIFQEIERYYQNIKQNYEKSDYKPEIKLISAQKLNNFYNEKIKQTKFLEEWKNSKGFSENGLLLFELFYENFLKSFISVFREIPLIGSSIQLLHHQNIDSNLIPIKIFYSIGWNELLEFDKKNNKKFLEQSPLVYNLSFHTQSISYSYFHSLNPNYFPHTKLIDLKIEIYRLIEPPGNLQNKELTPSKKNSLIKELNIIFSHFFYNGKLKNNLKIEDRLNNSKFLTHTSILKEYTRFITFYQRIVEISEKSRIYSLYQILKPNISILFKILKEYEFKTVEDFIIADLLQLFSKKGYSKLFSLIRSKEDFIKNIIEFTPSLENFKEKIINEQNIEKIKKSFTDFNYFIPLNEKDYQDNKEVLFSLPFNPYPSLSSKIKLGNTEIASYSIFFRPRLEKNNLQAQDFILDYFLTLFYKKIKYSTLITERDLHDLLFTFLKNFNIFFGDGLGKSQQEKLVGKFIKFLRDHKTNPINSKLEFLQIEFAFLHEKNQKLNKFFHKFDIQPNKYERYEPQHKLVYYMKSKYFKKLSSFEDLQIFISIHPLVIEIDEKKTNWNVVILPYPSMQVFPYYVFCKYLFETYSIRKLRSFIDKGQFHTNEEFNEYAKRFNQEVQIWAAEYVKKPEKSYWDDQAKDINKWLQNLKRIINDSTKSS